MNERELYRAHCSRATLQNKKEGCFLDLVDNLACQIKLEEFASCSTDAERIEFCVDKFWDSIGAELIFRGKNSEDGKSRRLDGNAAFEQGDLQKALLYYNQSVIKTPPGEDLAALYANRSALLFQLKEWELAIEDAQLAMSANYPEEKRHILYERMASSYLKLRNFTKAKITLGLAQYVHKKLPQMDPQFLKKVEKIQGNIQKFVGESQAVSKVNSENVETRFNRSQMFPAASQKFSVVTSSTAGRSVVALERVEAGEEVLAEEPFASCIIPERNGSHCHHCLRRLKAPVPCELCAHVAFCSTACRKKAQTYHEFECRVLLLLIGSGMSVLPLLALRIITQQPLQALLDESSTKSLKPDEVILNGRGEYDNTSYRSIYNLTGNENLRPPDDFFQRTLMAVFLLKCLRLVGYFEVNMFTNPRPTGTMIQVGALLLRNLQILQFNAYEIVETVLKPNSPLSDLRTVPVGLGIYPTAAFLNHSCEPVIARYFDGIRLHAIAIKPIETGAPITDNYGPAFTKVKKSERQKILEGRYWFSCTCRACVNDWNLIEEMEETEKGEDIKLRSTLEVAIKLLEEGNRAKANELLLSNINRVNGSRKKRFGKPYFLTLEALRLSISLGSTSQRFM